MSSSRFRESSRESVGSEEVISVEVLLVENRMVEMLAFSSNSGDVDKVNPSENDWVVTYIRIAFSKFGTSFALRILVDIVDILDP